MFSGVSWRKGWLPPSGEVLVYKAVGRRWSMGSSVAGTPGLEQGEAASKFGNIDEYQVGPWQAAGKDQ